VTVYQRVGILKELLRVFLRSPRCLKEFHRDFPGMFEGFHGDFKEISQGFFIIF